MRAFFKKDEALSQKFGPIITPLSAFYVDDINFDAKPGIFSHPVLQVSRLVGQASYFHLTVCVCVRGADRVRVCAGGLGYDSPPILYNIPIYAIAAISLHCCYWSLALPAEAPLEHNFRYRISWELA